jgi:hypothetical protein
MYRPLTRHSGLYYRSIFYPAEDAMCNSIRIRMIRDIKPQDNPVPFIPYPNANPTNMIDNWPPIITAVSRIHTPYGP